MRLLRKHAISCVALIVVGARVLAPLPARAMGQAENSSGTSWSAKAAASNAVAAQNLDVSGAVLQIPLNDGFPLHGKRIPGLEIPGVSENYLSSSDASESLPAGLGAQASLLEINDSERRNVSITNTDSRTNPDRSTNSTDLTNSNDLTDRSPSKTIDPPITDGGTKNPASPAYRSESSGRTDANSVGAELPVKYWGNSFSRKFHRPSCAFAKAMNAQHVVFFHFRREAIECGQQPCRYCLPPFIKRVECKLLPRAGPCAPGEVSHDHQSGIAAISPSK